ncbi:MAG: HEAT repeat domain-containing protein [Bryobacteraceae bacterium]
MKNFLLAVLFAASLSAAPPPEEELLRRLGNKQLTASQRSDACFGLRGSPSGAVIAAMRAALEDPRIRACAGAHLREVEDVDALRAALASENPELRALGARELGAMRKPELLTALAAAAADEHLLVATNAIEGLSHYDLAAALPALLEIAARGGMIGSLALDRAATSRDPRVLTIARRLMQSPHMADRLAGIRVAGQFGSREDLDALRKFIADEESYFARGRGFGLLPAISLSRAARTAIAAIESRSVRVIDSAY